MSREKTDRKREQEWQRTVALYRISDELTGRQKVSGVAAGTGVCLAISFIFYHSVIPGVILSPLFLWQYLKRKKKRCYEKRLRVLREEFRELAGVMASFLLAGYSIENAMESARNQMAEQGKKGDLERILSCMIREIRMGENAENVWLHFSAEAPLDEIRDFGQIFSLSRRSGVSLAEVLRKVADQLTQKLQTEIQIETQSAGKRMEQKVMNLMPAAILVYICLTSAEMMEVMYTTGLGKLVMTVCLAVYAGAFWLSEKMLESISR